MGSNFNIGYSEDFDEDVRAIHTHIAYNLKNPLAASEQVSRIISATESLGIFPKLHRVRGKDRFGNEMRIYPIDNYKILYSVDELKHIVNISRVLYGRRNINSLP